MTKTSLAALLLGGALLCQPQAMDLAPVTTKQSVRIVELPGELQSFLKVDIRAKVRGYIERMSVDRGSQVKTGQLMAQLSAPELKAQVAEAASRSEAAQSEQAQSEAQLAAAQSTADRLEKAAKTPGAIAGNEVIQARKQVEAAQATVRAKTRASQAAQAALEAQQELTGYLKIMAPFDGVVTERWEHPGALVGPDSATPLVTIQQISHLRLVVPVPEESLGTVRPGMKIEFRVPAYPDRSYNGTIARISHALDPKTRTMPIELDVWNRDGILAPGMYPSVKWPVHRGGATMMVPKTSVVTTTERTFVIRDAHGTAEWVDVKKGSSEGDLVGVIGKLQAGDRVIRRATDEIRDGEKIGGK